MPTCRDHITQAEHNEKLISIIAASGSLPEFSDWSVTISFYAAVHYVEAVWAAAKPKSYDRNVKEPVEHCLDHLTRNAMVMSTLRPIHRSYSTLYKYSKIARYNCYEPYTYVRADADSHLETIKIECRKIISRARHK